MQEFFKLKTKATCHDTSDYENKNSDLVYSV